LRIGNLNCELKDKTTIKLQVNSKMSKSTPTTNILDTQNQRSQYKSLQ